MWRKNIHSVVNTLCFHCRGHGFNPRLGNYDLACHEVKWKWLSRVRLFAMPCTIPSMDISRPEYWRGLPFLLQGIFPTQGSKPGLLHCRRILYQLSHKGSPACHVAWSKKYTRVQFKIKKRFGCGCKFNIGLDSATTRRTRMRHEWSRRRRSEWGWD